jgi:TatD DNase family protein
MWRLVRRRAAAAGVAHCVLPAVQVANFENVRLMAHQFGDSYALGIHPLCTPQAQDADLALLDAALARTRQRPAPGGRGRDRAGLFRARPGRRTRQQHFYREQLRLARRHGLPVIVHVRRSADKLLRHLRELPVAGALPTPSTAACNRRRHLWPWVSSWALAAR